MQKGFVPLLVVVGVLIIVVIGITLYSGKISLRQFTSQLPSPNPLQSSKCDYYEVPETPAQSFPSLSGSQLVFFAELRNPPEDLWTINPNGDTKVFTGRFFGFPTESPWSPDNKYILVSLWEKDVKKTSPVVLNITSGEIIKLKTDNSSGLFWLSEDEVGYFQDLRLHKISVRDGKVMLVSELPEEFMFPSFANPWFFSSDKKWMAIHSEENTITSYNLNNNKKEKLWIESEIGELEPGSWMGTGLYGWRLNKVIYYVGSRKGSAIWEANPDGSGRKRIVELEAYTAVGPLFVSKDGNRIFYVISRFGKDKSLEFFVYDFSTGVTKKLSQEEEPWHLEGISPNEKFITFTLNFCPLDRKDGAYLRNLQTGETFKLPCSSCRPKWSN